MFRRSDWRWAAAAAGVHLLLLAGVAWQNGGFDPLWNLHDAVYYRAHLADPLLQGDISWWSYPAYRAVRLGYVLLALPFRWLGVDAALVAVNLMAVGLGTVAVRVLARTYAANQALAAGVWILNPGALVSTALLLPDTIAWTAILFYLIAVGRRRWSWAVGLAVMATVTKEASLVAVGLSGLVAAWADRNWRPLLPAATAGGLHMGLVAVLANVFGGTDHALFVGWPLVGWWQVFDTWGADRPISRIVGLAVLGLGVLVLVVWWRGKHNIVLAAAAGQATLMLVLHAGVLFPLPNTTRIAGLFWPALAIARRDTSELAGKSRSAAIPHDGPRVGTDHLA